MNLTFQFQTDTSQHEFIISISTNAAEQQTLIRSQGNNESCTASLLAVRRHVGEDAQQEVSLQAGVKGCRYDDVPALFQVDA